eukprot:CAMPEP_0173058118 /NCGR_PEP_ID=MMETSP1102-20130122/1162_1 /TAXON_ID=49646 /ORGANISM="Geminigera sp., Strain Caron Lab Isolate" /LENGTH=119 /DNA_ID=CAMNT_0013923797 /DNA_START=824 /DNA_END=1183 /DNA_ORIENTATION=+
MAHFPEVTVTQNTGAAWARAAAAQCSLACDIGIPNGIVSWLLSISEDESEQFGNCAKFKNVPAISHIQVPYASGLAPGGHVRHAVATLVYTTESRNSGDGCSRAARTRETDITWHGWLE